MREDHLLRAVAEAAARLREEGWEATADGPRLVCRAPGGLEVEIENRWVSGDGSRWDELLNRLVAAILEAAGDEEG